MSRLLYPQELAEALGKSSRTYIFAMKKAGFVMPGGTATLEEARQWLLEHPNFTCTNYCQGKKKAPEVHSLDISFD